MESSDAARLITMSSDIDISVTKYHLVDDIIH